MDIEIKIDNMETIPEIPKKEPMFSSGCKMGTLMFVGSMIIIAGIILGITLG